MSTTDFSALALSKPMVQNLNQLGFTQMTSIQAKSLPHILKNKDVTAQAKTGSGKTAAFGIGILSKLQVNKHGVQSLVLCPTRELAEQVATELRRIARFTSNIKVLTLCGGVAFKPQVASLRHDAHIVVGTPGRILKHLTRGSLSLTALDTLVIDEAHRMLDMGFIDEIRRVIHHVPEKRQTLLFSATYPDEIMALSASIQTNAVHIETISVEKPNPITEYFYNVAEYEKLLLLVKLFTRHQPSNAIVFCTTKAGTREVAGELQGKGIDALAMHGDLEQYERTDVLVRFINHSCSVMVATDVAARGLDIKGLDMVVNYDMPQDEATYTHRIGRTGRAGQDGLAVTLYSGRQAYHADHYKNETRIFVDEPEGLIKAERSGDLKPLTLRAPNTTLVIEGGR
ncbi:MAG: ATP-dependent RNA helicase DbpA, partial [Chloroflexota bacterium]